jgi:hypothetical protein
MPAENMTISLTDPFNVLPSLQAIQRAFHPAAATPEMALTINHQLFTLNFLESINLSLGLGTTRSQPMPGPLREAIAFFACQPFSMAAILTT